MRRRRFSRWLPVLLGVLLVSGSAWAADDGHDFHHHHAAVVGGGAFKAEKPKSSFFLGVEYEYLFNPKVGIAAYYEETTGDFDLQALGALFVWHPTGGLKLSAGVAVERKFGDRKSKALIRFQVAYDFHAGKVSYGPMAAWDLIEDQSNVVFVGFGVGFGF